jgi:hypothetical protein
MASRSPLALKASDEIEAEYLGSCRKRFFAMGSQIETTLSPPPVANVPWLCRE